MANLKETILKFRANVVGLNPNCKLVTPSETTSHFPWQLLFLLFISNSLFAQIASFGKAVILLFFSRRDGKPKQWGCVNKKKAGRLLEERTLGELSVLRKAG